MTAKRIVLPLIVIVGERGNIGCPLWSVPRQLQDGNGACLTMKNIGKPCTGKLYARFDEGALRKTSRWLT
jgi:hypothetical protein